MPVHVDCPECGKEYQIGDHLAGKKIRCKKCEAMIRVPDAEEESPRATGVRQGALSRDGGRRTAFTRDDDDDDDRPRRRSEDDRAPAGRRRRRRDDDDGSKKTLLIAGIIGGAVLLIGLGIGAFFLFRSSSSDSSPPTAQRKEKDKEKVKVKDGQPDFRPAWIFDLAKMEFPDGPVAGQVAGADFKAETITYTPGVATLVLRDAKGREIIFFLGLGQKSLEGAKFEVEPRMHGPHIHGAAGLYVDRYAMKLEFGKAQAGLVPGAIYISFPDDHRSVIAGKFVVQAK